MPADTRIDAGKLRHRIIIVKPSLGQDSSGGWQIDEQNIVATVWASVEALTGRELYAAQQKTSEVTHKIRMRWWSGIVANMNVWFEGRMFEIEAVSNPDERKKLLELLCVERDDSQRDTAGTAA